MLEVDSTFFVPVHVARSIETGAQSLVNGGAIEGIFQTSVKVEGQSVTVRGRVIGDVVSVSAALIP